MKFKQLLTMASLGLALSLSLPSLAEDLDVSGTTVQNALNSLKLAHKEHDDEHGNPHFTLSDKQGAAKEVALFLLDCEQKQCEDIVAYANFGKVAKLSLEQMNEWNHISSMLRSRLARSTGGEVVLSLPISFYSDQDSAKIARMLGLFLQEVTMLSRTINTLK